MRTPLALCFLLAAPSLASVSLSQTVRSPQTAYSSAPEPTGTIVGHVFCGDTNQPARFARVSVLPMPDPAKNDPGKNSVNAITQAPSSSAPSSSAPLQTISTSVETTLDGSYTLRNVKPGRYYVVVEKEGYINPRAMFTQSELSDTSDQMRSVVEAALPHLKLEANQTERSDIRLERGAAITGQIVYDDGTPAGELRVRLLHKDEKGKWVAVAGSSKKYGAGITTDDRGEFRMSSLLPDEYMLEADMSLEDSKTSTTNNGNGRIMQFVMNNSRFSLAFYGDGTPHQEEARTITLHQGQELTGQTITLPISKLHRFTGHVAAGADAHYVNAASVALVDADTKKQLATADVSRDDGLFHFEFIPPGTYTLQVQNARDVVWDPPPPPRSTSGPGMMMADPMGGQDVERTLQSYGGTEQAFTFEGDKLGYVITVPPNSGQPNANSNPSQAAAPTQRTPAKSTDVEIAPR